MPIVICGEDRANSEIYLGKMLGVGWGVGGGVGGWVGVVCLPVRSDRIASGDLSDVWSESDPERTADARRHQRKVEPTARART